MAKAAAEFDIIVYGASGSTGRLVAEYLAEKGVKRWAMGGRSLEKLAEVRDLIGAPAETPLVAADSDDALALKDMCERTRVVITTVGGVSTLWLQTGRGVRRDGHRLCRSMRRAGLDARDDRCA